MNELYSILLKSSVSIALLYLIYILFLKRDTFFQTNRFYLVGAMLLSAFVPFIDLSGFMGNNTITRVIFLDPVIITPGNMQQSISSNPGFYQILLAIYFTGAGLFALRFAYQLLQLFFLVRKFGVSRQAGMRIVFTDKNYSPFSFFNLVFLNSRDTDSGDTVKILAHEKIHVRQWHSLDLIILEVITIFLWFNPFIWPLRHSIKTLHEYLADEGVIQSGVDANVYSALLFKQSTGIQVNDLTNNFSKSLLKRRFAMMNKKRTLHVARFKLLVALPLAFSILMILSFSQEVFAQEKKKDLPPPPPKQEQSGDQAIEKQEALKEPVSEEGKKQIYTVVEVMPEFPGGTKALHKYMADNIKYPEEALKKGISGTVYVSFIIFDNGEVDKVSILRGVGYGLDEEALRVVKTMPKWKPGTQDGKAVNVAFNLPINFKLSDSNKKKEEKKEVK